MAREIFTESFDTFRGAGFAPEPGEGQLDSDRVSIEGATDGDVAFGAERADGDFARGVTAGGATAGGVYALDRGEGDFALLLQPSGTDFTPGMVTLRLPDGLLAEDESFEALTLSFDLLINNDQPRANALSYAVSADGGATFAEGETILSDEAADAEGFTLAQVEASFELALDSDSDVLVRFALDDATGSGSRDEFAIDDVSVSVDDGAMSQPFTLELLHIADQEAGGAAVGDAPRLSAVLNALRAQDIGEDGEPDNTIALSSGDAFIPGVFFDASSEVFGSGGIADIQIQNELGLQAVALGNHEFDFGTDVLAGLISGEAEGDFSALTGTELDGQDFAGTAFPYLSANLGVGTDAALAPLEVEAGQAPQGNVVTSSAIVDVEGEPIGVVGATTPRLATLSSPGDVTVLPQDPDDLAALAAEIQAEVDALLATGLDKVILLSHLQQITLEQELAPLLRGVDVIVAGGSNTRLFDEDDRPRDGDGVQGAYPIETVDADGNPLLIVNTDGSYKYVGRLVIDFDEDGVIVPGSYDPEVSGAYATDEEGVAALDAADDVDPEVQAIADAIGARIAEIEGNVLGTSEVFLNGNRSGTGEPGDPDGVRTQETNLGNLTADANLVAAQAADEAVVVSIKNGGGIRASIGEAIVPAGGEEVVRGPNGEIVDADGQVVKPEGGISQNDVQTTLAFNNGLTLLTLTRAQLVEVLEFGVAALPEVSGRFPQVAGVEFAFDPDAEPGDRITSAAIVGEDGAAVEVLVRDGEVVGDPASEFRIVTLSFLADGGDGYPFPQGDEANRVDLAAEDDAARTGDASFAPDGTEQDALAEFLLDADGPVGRPDEGPAGDERIQNLDFRDDTVLGDLAVQPIVVNEVLGSTTGTDSEYVELFGPAGASLDGLSVIVVEGEDEGQIGDVSFRLDLGADDALGDNGFFLAANGTAQQTYGVAADVTVAENAIENGAYTAALVETASLTGDAVTGAEVVLDAVAVTGATPGTFFFDAPVIGPDGDFLPAGAGRLADGVDTDAPEDFEILSFFNESPPNSPTPGTGGDVGGGGDGSIDDAPTLISAVQGAGDASPVAGQTVVVEGIVTGDFQTGDGDETRNLDGFFVMEETVDQDGDAATSEGLFAFEGGATATDVSEGDTVRVLGTVVERFDKTTIEVDEIRVESAGTTGDALALAVSTPLPATEDREALEAMLVTFDEPLTFVESFDYEQFNAGTLASGGPVFQYTQTNDPDVPGNQAFQEEVADRTILIEDGLDGRRGDLDPILQPDGEPFAVDQGIRMGQELQDQTAIVDEAFGDYRLRVPGSAEFDPVRETNPRPLEPEDVGSDYKVAAFNVLNYFTTLDQDGNTTDNGSGPRGAESAEELQRQQDKIVAAITALDADVVGLIEIENDFAGDDFALATLVDALNAAEGAERWAFVDPGTEFVGTDAISNAFIYDRTTTATVGEAFVLDDAAFTDPLGTGRQQSRPAIFQTFEEVESGEAYTAVVNHYKSKGSLTGAPEDEDQGDGAGRNDATREAASEALLDVIAADPTGSGDEDVLILGDLNAYGREDPITVLEEGGFTDLGQRFEGEATQSFRFSGQVGTLDYALAGGSLDEQVTGATIWNISSDELFVFDYNLESTFGQPILRPQDQGLFDGDNPAKASDHDAVLVGLDLGSDDDAMLIAGTVGADRLVGTEAAEVIDAAGGFDVVSGGGGGDVFRFTDVEGSRDTLRIRDFDVAQDAIDLQGAVVESARSIGSTLRIRLEGGERDTLLVRGADDLADITFVEDTPLV